MKDGCVERAIVSAGGPKVSCQGQGLGAKKRRRGLLVKEEKEGREAAGRKRREIAVTEALASRLPASLTPSYVYNSSVTLTPTYVPMMWNEMDQGPVVLTSTFMTAPTVVFTTVIPATPTITITQVTTLSS